MNYDKVIDKKWQEKWRQARLFNVDVKNTKDKYYCLVMFPYPSNELHAGHARNYVIGDAVSRYKLMQGFNVLSPIGWDSFGLPAENQAIKRKIQPKDWTLRNIKRITEQLTDWGIGYDWPREITTCLPEYYKWTQWIFLKLYEKGLAYRKEASVNWCSSCQTVLANEQVINDTCERCSTKVEQKKLRQWFFKTTAYADKLLEDLKYLGDWPDRVKLMQQNWIGRSTGVEINFDIEGSGQKLTCFTTRVDTIFGATFIALSYEHPFIKEIAQSPEIKAFIEKTKGTSVSIKNLETIEKEGIFTGRYAINPMNGKKIPIWIANYILSEYGTGAIMCVPAHDERDFDFAEKYNLPIVEVVHGKDAVADKVYEGEGIMVNSGEFNGLTNKQAQEKIALYMESKKIGLRKVNYKLRDWLISRQRYWGAPIPIIYCDTCGEVTVPEKDLPVYLPDNVEFMPTGQSPLTYVEEFKNVKCPKCGKAARRETDTCDTFVDSSWYYLRYISPKENNVPFVKDDIKNWLPVDQYIGGVEHAILHLMYSRFIYKALIDIGAVTTDYPEPFKRLFTQGMIVKDGFKMSKSKGNVVAPDYIIDKYGADGMRLYILFMGPPEKDAEWQDEGLQGTWRFMTRAVRLADMLKDYSGSDEPQAADKELLFKIHSTIKEVTEDLEGNFQFNTAISRIMELVNHTYKSLNESAVSKPVFKQAVETIFKLLAPFTPHLSEEINEYLGSNISIFKQAWPKCNAAHLVQNAIEIAVLINGKVRDKLVVSPKLSQDEVAQKALSLEKIAAHFSGRSPKKIIFVPGRIINLVG
jgi:leucyl-tRNA synthetase